MHLKIETGILEANHNYELAKLDVKNYNAYPKSSSKYNKAQMTMLLAETAA